MKIAVVGSRSFNDEQLLRSVLDEYTPTEIISGGSSGADQLAAKWAKEHGVRLTEYLPNNKRFGRAAPVWRKNAIVNDADMVIAFWDGNSEGTKYVIDLAKLQGKILRVVLFS